MCDAAKPWIEQATYDLETARAMMESGRYVYVLFCCQQAVEKWLKAIVAKRTEQLPPRSHELLRLAQAAGVSANEAQEQLLRELSAYYVQSRYPADLDFAGDVSEGLAKEVLRQTEEFLGWLSSIR